MAMRQKEMDVKLLVVRAIGTMAILAGGMAVLGQEVGTTAPAAAQGAATQGVAERVPQVGAGDQAGRQAETQGAAGRGS